MYNFNNNLGNQLTSDVLFPTIVWRKELNYDNTDIKDYVNNLMLSDNGAIKSNYGGWQSKQITHSLPKELSGLTGQITNVVNEICYYANLLPLNLDNLWFNVNTPGTYNTIHNHPDSVLSGVYYIDVPEASMGDIEFYRADDSEYYLLDQENTAFGSQRCIYKATTGVLLIFPSWLKHSVQGNFSKKNRISMSFNYVRKNQ